MIFWFSTVSLALEAARVAEARLHLMARGACSLDELFLMFTEKFDAIEDTRAILARGGRPELVVANYRRIVAANASRLWGPKTGS